MNEERLNELFNIVNEGYSSIQEREIRDYITNLQQENRQLKEVINKAIEYIKENKEKYYQDWGQDDCSTDTYLDEDEVLKLLQILEDKEVSE